MEYAFGTDPNDTEERPDIEALVVSAGGNDYLAIRFAARTGANDLEITGEISNDLVTWQTNTISFGNPVPLEGDRQRITLRSTEPIPASATQQVRLRVVISQ